MSVLTEATCEKCTRVVKVRVKDRYKTFRCPYCGHPIRNRMKPENELWIMTLPENHPQKKLAGRTFAGHFRFDQSSQGGHVTFLAKFILGENGFEELTGSMQTRVPLENVHPPRRGDTFEA